MQRPTARIAGAFLCAMSLSSTIAALDCGNPQTQTDMNTCASLELDRETKKINLTYNQFRSTLNPTQKQKIKEVQLAWIKFKDLACQFEASSLEGGSADAMVLNGCLAEKTRQRHQELRALKDCEEGDLSCPAW
jgi:uncharacterized protein YecT (DUF1311 family)